MAFWRANFVLLPILFSVAVADTELPIDQEVRDGLHEAMDHTRLVCSFFHQIFLEEAIADAEFPDYKRYLDDFVKETCGAANTCKVPKGVCQKSAPGLQLAFQARNVTNVRRVAQVLVEDKNPKKLFACGTSGGLSNLRDKRLEVPGEDLREKADWSTQPFGIRYRSGGRCDARIKRVGMGRQ
ncbi:unnamed protein product, partial [Mesorhabditis spiculigera]